MNNEVITGVKKEFDGAIAHLQDELKKVRTGRASAGMLDGLMVSVYGSQMPLVAVGSVTVPEAQLIQITPFDPSNLQAIASAIRDDQTLGLNPVDDGRVIRLQIPPLTTERRQQIVKQLGEKAEECRIRLRNARHDGLAGAKKLKDDKQIGEDEQHRIEKQIDDLMNQMKAKVDELISVKEKEIMTV